MRKSTQPGARTLIIILVIAGILLVAASAVLVKILLDSKASRETSFTTTSPDFTSTGESPEDTSLPAETTKFIPDETSAASTTMASETTIEATTAAPETSSAVNVEEAAVLEIIQQGDALALQLFSAAFEDEMNGIEKIPFTELRPLLLDYWTAAAVDGNLAPFYEEYLDLWGYEMMYVFPLAEEQSINDYFIEFVSWSDAEIIAEFNIPDEMAGETYLLHVVLVWSGDTWLIHDRYTPGW